MSDKIKFSQERENNLIKKMGSDWYNRLKTILWSNKFKIIKDFLRYRAKQYKQILPFPEDLFNAFKLTPWDGLKVVIIGGTPNGDMYKGQPAVDGLAYSYTQHEKFNLYLPKDIKNIMTEIDLDMGDGQAFPGRAADLSDLAEQGVLLLNSELTCEKGFSTAHKNVWSEFIQYVISYISGHNAGIIFMLWGVNGKKYDFLIDENNHYILRAGDPALGGPAWFGSNHFSKANQILKDNNGPSYQIKWTNHIF
jgi:uracil-DNA glycosylase